MKRVIITHPTLHNYGGILQCYALQETLQALHIGSTSINFIPDYLKNHLVPKKQQIKNFIKVLVYLLFLTFLPHRKRHIPLYLQLNIGYRFTKKYLSSTSSPKQDDEAYIVGSDQVWRACYARALRSLPFFFLSFASSEQRKKSIAYAASFGTDEWEGSEEETIECKKLLHEFKAVSVREHSGVNICREIFGINAVQMPDPTLLLTQENYNQLINAENTWAPHSPYIASYILDKTSTTSDLLQKLQIDMNIHIQPLQAEQDAKTTKERWPFSVAQWLRFIRESNYIVTDSFHGCVFAIIFNKPFVCLGNENRGSARFDSLLGTFGLRNRLGTNLEYHEILQILTSPIDWNAINDQLKYERERGKNFLHQNLL